MARILLQTTIAAHFDDWDVSRFSLLAAELRGAGARGDRPQPVRRGR